jgi:hypothetical protein
VRFDGQRSGHTMSVCQSFRLSKPQPRWLPAATLGIALSLAVPIAAAGAVSPTASITDLQRDLGALQALLEQVGAGPDDSDAKSAGSHTDLGDGSSVFRRRSLVTIVHTAARDLDQLIGDYRAAGDRRRASDTQTLRVSMYELSERIERLAEPAGPKTITVLRDQSRSQLTELVQDLDLLVAEPVAAPTAAPGPQPRS